MNGENICSVKNGRSKFLAEKCNNDFISEYLETPLLNVNSNSNENSEDWEYFYKD